MIRLRYSAVAIISLAFVSLALPGAAWASVSGTPTLNSGQTLSLDTGVVAASGGDILWNGSTATITFLGSATGVNVGNNYGTGATVFSELEGPDYGESFLAGLPGYSSASLSGLFPTSIYAVHTNGGNYSLVMIVSMNGTSIGLQFITFTAPAVPTITQVLNNYGLIPSGFANSGIAPGALFLIQGSDLASATTVSALESSVNGLPTSLNGASVSVISGGVTTYPVFYYAIATQLALVLPSNTPAGIATVTVTYNGQTSAPYSFNVVPTSFGFAAYYGTGSGLGLATNASTYTLYNYSNSIPPGTTVVFWGSGLGADPARDTTYTPAQFSIPSLAHVYVGGIDASISYQGASGYPGVNQINVTIPDDVQTGCFVSVVGVTAAGVPTNFITLPIGNGDCEDPGLGYSGSTLTSLSALTSVNTGLVEMIYSSSQGVASSEATASFQSFAGTAYGSSSGNVSSGGCIVNESLASSATSGTSTGLNAGTITVSSPNTGTSAQTLTAGTAAGSYGVQLPNGFLTSAGGSFPFTATQGTQVGAFNIAIAFPTPLLSWTNQSAAATVTRSAGLPITWTGGAQGTYVIITGSSASGAASDFFVCTAPAAAGQFTVPSYVLATMLAGTTGALSVGNETVPQSFTAAGLDFGYALAFAGYTINTTFQ